MGLPNESTTLPVMILLCAKEITLKTRSNENKMIFLMIE
jgi:hypothetical protein